MKFCCFFLVNNVFLTHQRNVGLCDDLIDSCEVMNDNCYDRAECGEMGDQGEAGLNCEHITCHPCKCQTDERI